MQLSSVNIQDLDSGGRGRRFKSSYPDQYFQFQISPLQTTLPAHSFFWDRIVGLFVGNMGVTFAYVLSFIGHRRGH